MTRILSRADERESVARQIYKLHLDGVDIPTASAKLDLPDWQVTQLLKWHMENKVATPEETEARKTALSRAEHDLEELAYWQAELRRVYEDEQIGVEKAGKLAATLVKVRTDVGVRYAKLLGLDGPLNINLTKHSDVDAAIIELSRLHGAQAETDAPLDW